MRAWLWIAFICLVGMHPAGASGQTVNTNGLIRRIIALYPIETKADDVKALVGEPLSTSPDFYKLEEFNLQVSYGGELPCDPACGKNEQYCGWNVPKGTLLTLAIIVKRDFHRQDLMKLGIDLNKFNREENADHIPGMAEYSCAEQGLGIIINGNQVESISLYPAKKYFHLMCLQPKERTHCSN